MADPSPLLSQSDSIQSELPHPQKQNSLSLDDVIEHCTGRFGWNQLLQTVLVSFAWAFEAQQTFISVFVEASPAWHCTDPESCNIGMMNQCQLPSTAWAWNEPASKTSLVSEWDLACGGAFLLGLPTSSFFLGSLIGGLILATLADSSLGRKKLLVLSCLVMSLASVLTVFSPNVWVYSALRFITGFGRSSVCTCALVLSTEMVGKRWRGQVGIIGFLCFTLGFLSLPAMAYLNRDSSWRTLYLWMSIPAIFYSALVYLIVHESPRWLFVRGRKEEAIKVLKRMMSSTDDCVHFEYLLADMVSMEKETSNVNLYAGIKILWEKRWAFRRLSSVMIVGFGTGMVYYGMPLGVGNLRFNLYLSVTLNALSELPASFTTFFLISKLNRRTAVFVLTTLSGVCSVMCVLVGEKELQIGFELVSFFSACTAFNVLLIYTLELFPTCVRNSALSVVRQAIVLGGAISPVLVAAGRGNGFLSYGVFGVLIGCCGLFVVRLPETRGGSFCDTMEEEEHKDIKAALLIAASAAGGDNGV